MHYFRQTWLIAALGLACGGKDEGTATESSETGAATTASSSDASAGTTEAPTTTASTSGASSSGADVSTGEQPACETSADDCGVSVSDDSSQCVDPPPAKNELVLEVLGPGLLKIIEKGYTAACNITVGSKVYLDVGRRLVVSYEINGQPNRGCYCAHEVTSTVSGLQSGLWTVIVGSYEQQIEIP